MMLRTQTLRQVIDSVQGFVGVQQLWADDKTGAQEWRWLETVTIQSIGGSSEAVAAARQLSQ